MKKKQRIANYGILSYKLVAAWEFGIEAAMYSILVYVTSMKTSSYIVDGFEEYTALTMISKNYKEVKSLIVNNFGKGI